jgi:hypothetical protein
VVAKERPPRRKFAGAFAGFLPLLCLVAFVAPASAGPAVPHTLTVVLAGTGAGSVTEGTNINCPGTCTHSYLNGTVVTLAETPAVGSTFGGWSGGGCTGTGACTVTMSSDQTVTATFTAIPPTGDRAAALKKCKHKHGKKRKKCKKKAMLLPV